MLCLEKYARQTLFRNAYASIMLLRRDHRHQIHRSVSVERERERALSSSVSVVLETTMHAQLDSPDAIPLPSCASGEWLFVETIRAEGAA